MPDINTVPNQRVITVNKEICDRENRYTTNNLAALDEAAKRLVSKGGFKLYIYLAKNQNNYKFALSSSDFSAWSGLSLSAYTTAFKELVKEGYLIKTDDKSNLYSFYDKSRTPDINSIDNVTVEIHKDESETKEEKEGGFIF